MWFRLFAWTVPFLLVTKVAASQGANQRPMTVDDLFTLSALGGVALSPDGEWIAATVVRPGSTSRFGCILCNYHTLADVWVINRRTGERRNLTRGDAKGSGSWLPAWSPNGRRLAFVSTQPERGEPHGGNNVRLYVWDAVSGRVSRVSTHGTYLQADIQMPGTSRLSFTWLNQSFVWLNDTTLLAALLPHGTAADEVVLPWRRGVADATREWGKWERMVEPTASVLESGGPTKPLPTVSLQRIDVGRGTHRAVAELPRLDLWDLNTVMRVVVSPNLQKAAVLAPTGTITQRPERRLTGELRTHQVGVVSIDGSAPVAWASSDQVGEGVAGQLFGWSPDNTAFVIVQQVEPWTRPRRQVAIVINAGDVGVRQRTPAWMTVDTVVWTADSRILAYARPLSSTGHPSLAGRPLRRDWWRLDSSGDASNATASMSEVPYRLYATTDPNRFVGIADRAVWAIDADRGTALRATLELLPANASIVRPLLPDPGSAVRADVLVQATQGRRSSFTRVTLRDLTTAGGASVTPIASPSSGAELLDVDPRLRAMVFSDETPEGISLFATDGQGAHVVRGLTLNEHVARIAQGRRLLFSYRGAEGDSLQGLALLPPNYESGKQYPVVVWAYGGLVIRDTVNTRVGKNYAGTFNMEVLAGRGYVVLFPSIPLPFGVKSDIWIDHAKGVIAAVDKLIELGVADPEKLAVMGHSFGGYGTYAVVTYTNRFKAAVAMSGHPDLISLYGQFQPAERYSDWAHEGLVTAMISEYGPFNMGGSLWDDASHYIRNSPIFFFDRVRTPLMIVHGDMDGAPIQQGEEAFTALYRLGKRARFVRYWGEGHIVASPVNVRHLWAQAFDWLDMHLNPGTAASRP